MDYTYAKMCRTVNDNVRKLRRIKRLVGTVLMMATLGGCSLEVAGLVDYGIGKLEQVAVEAVVQYVAPPPGVGLYDPARVKSNYEHAKDVFRKKIILENEFDRTKQYREMIKKMGETKGVLVLPMDVLPTLAWNI
jgi:hypothetical protein